MVFIRPDHKAGYFCRGYEPVMNQLILLPKLAPGYQKLQLPATKLMT